MKKRLFSIVLVAVLSISLLFSGCGAAQNNVGKQDGKPSPSNQADNNNPEPVAKDTIVVAVDDTYPPMEFKDENGELVGFDVDLAKAIGEKLGKKIEFKSVAWDGIFIGLETDRYDVIMSSVSMTPDRLENYEFTKPYLANGQVIVVKPGDNSVKTVDDLKGKKIGVQTETTSDTACKKKLEEKGSDFFEIMRYDEIIQTFEAMSAGHIDAIVVDYPVAMEYANNSPDKYAITTAQLTNEPIAACFKKGNTALRDEFQKALDELRQEGKLTEISEKWLYGQDYTQNIDENLY